MANLPDTWECDRYYLNGNGKLCATYSHKENDERVAISPYKSYRGVPGFANCHKIRHEKVDGTTEVVAKGLSRCEYVDETEELALEYIMEVEQ